MDIQTLRFFKTIADTGSFTAASETLHYAQSNLSTQIRKLEEELGNPLFIRNKKGISLTAKGHLFYEYAQEILALSDEACSIMTDMDHARGKLDLGSIEATALTFLPAFLQTYHKNNPDVKLSLKTEMNDVFQSMVISRSIDGVFIAGPVYHPELDMITISKEELILLGSENDSSISAEEILKHEELITFPEGSVFRRKLEMLLSSMSVSFTDRLTVFNTLSAMITNITAGLGYGYLPRSLADSYIKKGILREYSLESPYSHYEVVFVYRRDHIKDAAFRNFLDLLQQFSSNTAV